MSKKSENEKGERKTVSSPNVLFAISELVDILSLIDDKKLSSKSKLMLVYNNCMI